MASTNYINECKNDAYKNRLGKIEIAEKKVTAGTSIKIEKGADSAIDLTLYGRSTQATRSGKNLFTKQGNATPKTDTTFWNNITHTTPESDGWCKVSVDNTNGTTTVFANQFTKRNTIDKLEVNKTYSILVEVRNLTISGSSSTPPYLQLCETAKDSVWQGIQNYNLTIFKETNKVVFQKLTKTNFDSSLLDFRNFVSVPKGYKVEFEYRLMVVKGSYTLDTIGEYEPYGVMPSPDFPSPIESITEISATVTGKNLLENKTKNSGISRGITFTLNGDGSYTLNGTNDGTGNATVFLSSSSNPTTLKAGTYYTIPTPNGVHITGAKIGGGYFQFASSSTSQFTLNEDIQAQIYIQVSKGITTTYNNIKVYPMISTTPITQTDYEEYKSNSLAIDLQGNELCSLPNGTKDEVNITNGKSSIVKRTKEFILDENKTIVLEKALTNTTRFLIYNVTSSMNDYPSAISTHFKYLVDYNSDTEHFYITRNGAMYLFVNKSIASTVDELKTWLSKNNVKFLYELAEPETINLGTVEMLSTYDGVSNITNSADTEMTVKAYEWTDEITNYDNLQSIQIDSGCYTDGNIIGSVYVECLNASFVAEATNLVDKIIRCQIGVKYADLSTEYICKGKYIIERPNNEITAQMSQITAYSDLYTNLEAIYICNLDYSAGNITLKDVYIDVCKQLGLTPLKTDFLNSTIPIKDNPFKNNEKNRVVLQTISKIACSFVNVYEDNNQIDLCWLSENAEPDYTFEMSDYVSVEGGQVICGPINCLIIKNSQIDDENVTIKDDESIKANGEHSITISDDYILHNAELRQQAITSIWNRVKGLKYVDCKLITYYGKPFLKLGNKIRVYTSDTDYFDTYVLKHKFEYDGAFASTIESPALTEQEIKTKQDISLGKALTNVQIDLDKQKERITSTVTTTNALQDSVSNLSETVQEQANQMQTLSTTLTQTNQSLQAEVNQINESLENGVSNLKNKLVTIDINGIAVSTNTSAIKTIMNNDRFAIKNGNTEAFYVGYDENLKKSVSRMNDLTITDYFTAGYHRQEKFEINGEQRTGWFYVGGE